MITVAFGRNRLLFAIESPRSFPFPSFSFSIGVVVGGGWVWYKRRKERLERIGGSMVIRTSHKVGWSGMERGEGGPERWVGGWVVG